MTSKALQDTLNSENGKLMTAEAQETRLASGEVCLPFTATKVFGTSTIKDAKGRGVAAYVDTESAAFIVQACNAYGSTDALGHRYEVRDNGLLRIVYADVVVAAFSNEESREHVEHLARLLNFKDHKFAELARSTDALRSALAKIVHLASEMPDDPMLDRLSSIYVTAYAALSASPSPSTEGLGEWLPIETAPKDQFVFVYCPEDDTRWLAKFQDGNWHGVDDSGLTRTGMGPDDVTGWAVTKWMPLPAAPNAARTALAVVTAPETRDASNGD